MIFLTHQTPILLGVEPADFRKGIDGFVAVCENTLALQPRDGTVFVFINRARTRTTFRIPIVRSNHPLQVAPTSRSISGDTQDGSSRWRRDSAF